MCKHYVSKMGISWHYNDVLNYHRVQKTIDNIFVHQAMLDSGSLCLSILLKQCISKRGLPPFQKVKLISKYLDQDITCNLLKQ